ncbi:hypothetical protein [Novosphingobium sp. AAP1]|uniref:hypothetical protein n=1 Tax=Novosphingobium sp. AAP1 TaxID=1523413 RepID=UPI0012E2A90A|nr:hypothetical protein [Novosphingobium sp. AAP1]
MRLDISELKWAAWFCGLILLNGFNSSAKADERPGATGVCFSHLSALRDGQVISYHQVVLVRSSGDLARDIQRINSVSSDRWFFQNPHTLPNVWLSAWLEDQSATSVTGPDCSRLPMASH